MNIITAFLLYSSHFLFINNRLPFFQVFFQAIAERPAARLPHAKRLGDLGDDQTWVGKRGEVNEVDAVLKVVNER